MAEESIDNEQLKEAMRLSKQEQLKEAMRLSKQEKVYQEQLKEAMRLSKQDKYLKQQKEAIKVSEQQEQEKKSQDNEINYVFPTDNKKIVKELKELRDKNKMGLIIGRSDTEPIINEKGWIWVSFDIKERQIKPPTRYHIAGEDINEKLWPLKLGRTVGFDKVVVDWSTLKFIKTPWIHLHQILKNNNESQLITELTTGLFLIKKNKEDSWKTRPKGYNIRNNTMEMYWRWTKDEKEKHIKNYETDTIKYLKTLFNHVKYIKNKAYPTRQNMTHNKKVDKFLIMTGPKENFGGKKTKKVRKHQGINQTGGNKGRLKKGYKYSGKKLKSGLPKIVKVKKKKTKSITKGGLFGKKKQSITYTPLINLDSFPQVEIVQMKNNHRQELLKDGKARGFCSMSNVLPASVDGSIRNDPNGIVLIYNGSIYGFLLFSQHKRSGMMGGNYLKLELICTAKKNSRPRETGPVGKLLLQKFENISRQLGFKKIKGDGVPTAKEFYQKMGWTFGKHVSGTDINMSKTVM